MNYIQFSSVHFNHSIVSDSLQPYGLQHARLPHPSPTPGACSNSFRLSQWCHPTISSSVDLFSFCLKSFPASGSFLMSQLFASHSVLFPIWLCVNVVVQLLSPVRLFVTPWTAACQASVSFTISWSLPKTHVHWVDDAIQPLHPLSPLSPPALNLSQHQGLFQWVDCLHQVAKILELQLQHQSF